MMMIFCLTFTWILLFFNVECDSPFNHFTIKQCVVENNCNNQTNSILIAIDGTGSRILFEETNEPKRYESEIGINNNKKWIWQSHIANFWEEYQGESHYFYGPDANELISAGNEMHEIIEKSYPKICNFINNHFSKNNMLNEVSMNLIRDMTLNGDFGIDIIGYSRGGFIAMDLSRKLQIEGCKINNIEIKPITVRWMGLYDPVERDIDIIDPFDGYNDDEIAENVVNVSIAERSEFIHSRSYFGYAVDKDDYYKNRKSFDCSHGGIGGYPGDGDCKEMDNRLRNWFSDPVAKLCSSSYTVNMDKENSIKTDIWMRDTAINVNVPIRKVNQAKYYGDFQNYYQ